MLAQGVLGEDRHKTPNNFRPSAIPTRWAQELEKLKDRYEAAKTSKMRDDEQRIAQLEQERQELADNLAKAQAMLAAAEENARAAQKPHDAPPQSLQAPIAAAPTPTPTYGFALLQQGVSMILADILAGAIRSPQVRDAVASLVTVQAPSEPPHEPRPEAPPPVKAAVTLGYSTPKATKPARVLVVGLLGSQAETIRREFGDKLDLRFLTQEDSSERIKENSKSVDKVYALVGKMGHHIEKAIMQGGGRDKYVRINGTVSELARALTGFVNSGAPAPMH